VDGSVKIVIPDCSMFASTSGSQYSCQTVR